MDAYDEKITKEIMRYLLESPNTRLEREKFNLNEDAHDLVLTVIFEKDSQDALLVLEDTSNNYVNDGTILYHDILKMSITQLHDYINNFVYFSYPKY